MSSAQEAVVQIREKLGPEAEVISVKQVKGSGLERFLSPSPKLEVVAHVKAMTQVTEELTSDSMPEPVAQSMESASLSPSAQPTVSTSAEASVSENEVSFDPPTAAQASAKNEGSPCVQRSSLLERIRKQSNSGDLTCSQFFRKPACRRDF